MQGQFEALHLGPVVGDVEEGFGVGLDSLKGLVAGLYLSQVVFLLAFLSSLFRQAVLADDARDGSQGGLEAKVLFEPLGAEVGLPPCLEDLFFMMGGGFVGTGFGSPRKFLEARGALLLESSEPEPHGVPGAGEVPGRGADAACPGKLADFEPEEIFVVFGADHLVIWKSRQDRGASLLGDKSAF